MKISLVPICAALVFSGAASAQGVSTIVGTIRDPSGAVVPAAQVTVAQEDTRITRKVTPDSQGYYVVPDLRPSVYTVTVQSAGFRTYTQTGVTLLADQSLTVNVQLAIGQAAENVSVQETAPQVDTTTPTLQEVVDQKRIMDLPLNGRNAAALTTLVAGVVVDTSNNNDADQGYTKTFPEAVTISTNGSRQNQVNFLLDGGNNLDPLTNVNMPFPFPDALQEFSVQTSNYSARYGQNAGGVVNIVTRSGSNQFHGDLFEFDRNAIFNARNFFETDRDQLKRNQFGGTVGGPVILPHLYNGHDRTFFFLGFQGTEIRDTFGTQSSLVPTDADLAGNFSALLNAQDPRNPTGAVRQLIDPSTGAPFPNNQIPVSRFDPASVTLVTKYLPRASGDGLIFYPSYESQSLYQGVAKIDQQIGTADHLFFRYFGDHFENPATYDGSDLLTDVAGAHIFSQNDSINEIHIFRPNLLNDFSFTFSRVHSHRGPAANVPDLNKLGVGIYQPPGIGIESIGVGNYFGVGNTPPADFVRNSFSWSDNVSWVRGRHDFTFGAVITRSQLNIDNLYLTGGIFNFSGDYTGDPIADFLLGDIREFDQGNGQYGRDRNTFYGVYASDTFHVSRRLTLDLGLRWDPWFPVKELDNRVVQFEPSAYWAGDRSQTYANALPGEFFPGDPGFPANGVASSLDQFAPRVGFAYDLTGDGKTSLRGGAGIFYDTQSILATNWEMLDQSPFSPQLSLVDPAGHFSTPLTGISNPFPSPPPSKDAAFPQPVLVVANDPSGKFQVPTVYEWNLTVERQLAASWLLRAAYVGSHASHIRQSLDLNPAVYEPGSTLGPDQRRLFQGYSDIFVDSQAINSSYNSLQVTLQKRLSQNFSILANYTYSKSIDDMPFGGGVTSVGGDNSFSVLPWYFPNSHSMDRGPSEFDHTHVFVASGMWQLPALKGMNAAVRGFLGDWELSGILSAQTGDPLTLLAGVDRSQTASGVDRVVYLGGDPYSSGACAGSAPCQQWINPNAFGLPAIGTFGDTGKGSLRGPGLVNLDAGLFKNFGITESLRIQFRAEFFNALNHPNFKDPNDSLVGGGFGQIFSANDPRIGQLALKVLF